MIIVYMDAHPYVDPMEHFVSIPWDIIVFFYWEYLLLSISINDNLIYREYMINLWYHS